MARVVILSFENNAAASKFVKDVDAAQSAYEMRSSKLAEIGMIAASYGKLEALLARPTLACECKHGLGIRSQQYKSVAGFTKTAKFGWWVHAACRRPTKMVVDRFMSNLIISGGNNLLQQLLTPKEPVEVHVMGGPNPAMFEEGYKPSEPVDHERHMLEAQSGSNVADGPYGIPQRVAGTDSSEPTVDQDAVRQEEALATSTEKAVETPSPTVEVDPT